MMLSPIFPLLAFHRALHCHEETTPLSFPSVRSREGNACESDSTQTVTPTHLPVAGPDACPFLLTFQRLPWMDAMQLQPRQEHVIPGALRLTSRVHDDSLICGLKSISVFKSCILSDHRVLHHLLFIIIINNNNCIITTMLCNESMHLRTLQVHQNFLPTSIPAIIVYQESSYTHARTQIIVMRSCTTSLFIADPCQVDEKNLFQRKKRASVLGKLQSLRSIKMQRCHVQTCHLKICNFLSLWLFALGEEVQKGKEKKRKESESQSLVYYRSTTCK